MSDATLPKDAVSMELSSGPWKVAVGVDEAMENWLVASLGMCRDHGDQTIYVTTDHVHASDAVCYPYEDAQFIVKCRNYAHIHGDPLNVIERLTAERDQYKQIAFLNMETIRAMQSQADATLAQETSHD